MLQRLGELFFGEWVDVDYVEEDLVYESKDSYDVKSVKRGFLVLEKNTYSKRTRGYIELPNGKKDYEVSKKRVETALKGVIN